MFLSRLIESSDQAVTSVMGFCDGSDAQQQRVWHRFNSAAGGNALPAFEF
jgi:hypothetical protein